MGSMHGIARAAILARLGDQTIREALVDATSELGL